MKRGKSEQLKRINFVSLTKYKKNYPISKIYENLQQMKKEKKIKGLHMEKSQNK